MVLLLDARDIERLHAEKLVTMPDYVAAVEAAYRSRGEGTSTVMPRFNLKLDPAGDDRSKALKIGGATLPEAGLMGSALYAAGFQPGKIELWIMLYSLADGALAAMIHGQTVSRWKTGATGAAATKHMARPDAAIVGLIGTGRYAQTQLTGLASVRSLREVRCFSRSEQGRTAFVQWAKAELPHLAVIPVDTPRAATEGVDILVTITTSRVPVTSGDWITPGTHVSALGAHYPEMREIDTRTVVRSRVFVDDFDQALQEKGELLIPLKAGEISQDHILGDLGAVVAGKLKARPAADDITLFCSGGVAIEYLGSCAMLFERARAAGIGRSFDVA